MQAFFKSIKSSPLQFLKRFKIVASLFCVALLLFSWPQHELDAGASLLIPYGGSSRLKEFTKSMKNTLRIRAFGNETILYDARKKNHKEDFTVLNQNGYTPLFLYKDNKPTKKESLFGLLPSFFTRKYNKAMVLGLGVGMTASVVADLYDFVKVFEINPGTERIMRLLKDKNRNLMNKSNVEIVIQDGFIGTYLEEDKSYDVIISTLSNTTYYSASKLYSKEYFEIAKQKLHDEGVFAIWYDSRYSLSSIDTFYNTLSSVFKECRTFLLDVEYHLLICGQNLKYKVNKNIQSKNEFIKELVSHTSYLEINAQKYFGQKKYGTKMNTLNKLLTGYKIDIHQEKKRFPFIDVIEDRLVALDKDSRLKMCEALLFFGGYWRCDCMLNPKECCPANQVYCSEGIYEGQCRLSCNFKSLQ